MLMVFFLMLTAGLVCFWGMGFFFYAYSAFFMLMVFSVALAVLSFMLLVSFFMLMVFFMLRVLFFMRHCGKRSRWGVLVQNVIVRRV